MPFLTLIFQVVFSAWILYEILVAGWAFDYSFFCEPIDRSMDPKALRMANAAWWYFFSKFTEFLDTAFFVLRKKNEHVSSLHVIHHGIMPLFAWEACRWVGSVWMDNNYDYGQFSHYVTDETLFI